MHSNTRQNRGFTIVELLIVIVVIAILASISIVAYNGIQRRANVSAAYSDMKSLGQAFEIYRVDYGQYPTTNTEINAALAEANSTSLGHSSGSKSFVYCRHASQFTIVPWEPITVSQGEVTYRWKAGQIGEITYSYNGSTVGSSLCQNSGSGSAAVWSHSL